MTVDGGTPTTDRVAELERQLAEYAEELDATEARLRRAYAETENAQAQLDAGNRGLRSAEDGGASDEIQRLRVELGQAMERAAAAENRASRLQADLAEARAAAGGADLHTVPVEAGSDLDPSATEDEPDSLVEEDRSLRFRLARNAARKKGIGDEMWS